MSAVETAAGSHTKGAFHIPSLDGLRAIAVLIVFFSHVGLTRVMPGGFGVTIFFFLSGFLITTLLRIELEQRGRVSLRNFYLRRGLRILPLMYIVLGAATVATIALGLPLSRFYLALQALHLTNYLPLESPGLAIGTKVLWSLAVEEHFYLLFPIAYLALHRAAPAPERQAIVLLLACGFVLAWRCTLIFGFQYDVEHLIHSTDTRIDSILFGCALAVWRNPALTGPEWTARTVWWSASAATVVLVLSLVSREPTFRESIRYTIQGLALAPVFIAAVRYPQWLVCRFLNWPAVAFLGVLSYAFYLVHLPVIILVDNLTDWPEWLLTAVALGISVLLSMLLHFAVERPCARLRRRLSFAPRLEALDEATAPASSCRVAARLL